MRRPHRQKNGMAVAKTSFQDQRTGGGVMMKPSALNLRVVVICHTAFSLHLLSSAEEPLHPSALSGWRSFSVHAGVCSQMCFCHCGAPRVA